jgi:hypothetical protein
MKKDEYEKQIENLFKRWLEERPEYEGKEQEFTYDGISNFELWEKQEPKILFLVKESRQGFHPCLPNQKVSGKFGFNIARWKFVIKEFYKNPNTKPFYLEAEDMPDNNDDIALVEIKKVNDENSNSNYNEILRYAENDSHFLKEQIELINPNIVFCCYTIDAYGNCIYGEKEETWNELYSISEPKKCKCFKHRNRLIIDFYHPSSRSDSMELFELLYKLLKEGNVFEKFNWSVKQ